MAFLSFFGFVLTSAVILILAERKIMAYMQDRVGPVHTGPWGLLQTVADVGKLLMKEDVHVSQADKTLFILAPSVFLGPVIAAFAVLPLSPYVAIPGSALATGIVYYVAMSSIDVVGVVMAGWSSNNKYSLIGGLRSAAQMISYELPLVLALVGVVMLTSILANSGLGTIAVRDIMNFQAAGAYPGKGLGFFNFIFQGFTPWAWFFLQQPLMFIIYYICGLAETNRPPFDLPEAESELVAGYLTEYSGMRWGLFYLGEYGNMTIVSAIGTYLFLGGFSGPGVTFLTGLNNGWLGPVGQPVGSRLLHHQSLPALLRLHLGAQYAAAPARRPVDAVRLADPHSSHAFQYHRDGPDLPGNEQPGLAQLALPDRAGHCKLGHALRLHLHCRSRHHRYYAARPGSCHSRATPRRRAIA